MAKWYFSRDGWGDFGPYCEAELKQLAATGKIKSTDEVWQEGMENRVKARQVKGLFDAAGGSNDALRVSTKPSMERRTGEEIRGIEEEIRDAMSMYARRVPYHGIDDFGNAVAFRHIEKFSAFRGEVQTLYETREPIAKMKPYKEEAIPPLKTTLDNIRVFDLKFPLIERYAALVRYQDVEDSQIITGCRECGAKGEMKCHVCTGQQRTKCPVCDGSRRERCGRCHGDGFTERPQTIHTTRNCPNAFCKGGVAMDRVCSMCNGRGWISDTKTLYEKLPCSGCAGHGELVCRCCGGDGLINCPECSGKGLVICGACEGFKRVIYYITVKQEFNPMVRSFQVADRPCPEGVVALLEDPTDFVQLADVSAIEFVINPSLPANSQSLNDAVHRTIQQTRTEIEANCRIIKQNLRVAGTAIIKANYVYEDREFVFWLVGNRRRFYALPSPISEIARKTVKLALHLWSQKLRFAAATRARMVLGMAEADGHCQTALDSGPSIPIALKVLAERRHLASIAEMTKWACLILGFILPVAALALTVATLAGFRRNFNDVYFSGFLMLPVSLLIGYYLFNFWRREESSEASFLAIESSEALASPARTRRLEPMLLLGVMASLFFGLWKFGSAPGPTVTPVVAPSSAVMDYTSKGVEGSPVVTQDVTSRQPPPQPQAAHDIPEQPIKLTNAELQLTGHTGVVASVCYSPDGRYILSAGWDRTIRLWEASTGREIRCFNGHSKNINSVGFLSDGRRAISGSDDRTIRVWDLESGLEMLRMETGGEVQSISVVPGGSFALSAQWGTSGDKPLRVWNTRTGRPIFEFASDEINFTSVVVSPDGRFALSGEAGHDAIMRLWDLNTGEEIRRFEGHIGWITSVAISPDGRLALSAGEDRIVRLWDIETGRELHRLKGHEARISAVSFSPDGRSALSGSWDGSMSLWDIQQRRELCIFTGHDRPVNGVSFAPNARHASSASWDYVRVWEIP